MPWPAAVPQMTPPWPMAALVPRPMLTPWQHIWRLLWIRGRITGHQFAVGTVVARRCVTRLGVRQYQWFGTMPSVVHLALQQAIGWHAWIGSGKPPNILPQLTGV